MTQSDALHSSVLENTFITSLSCQESAASTDGKNSVFNVLSESFPANLQECSKSLYFYFNICIQLLIRNPGVLELASPRRAVAS